MQQDIGIVDDEYKATHLFAWDVGVAYHGELPIEVSFIFMRKVKLALPLRLDVDRATTSPSRSQANIPLLLTSNRGQGERGRAVERARETETEREKERDINIARNVVDVMHTVRAYPYLCAKRRIACSARAEELVLQMSERS